MDDFLERWLEAVISTPGMTGLTDRGDARRVLLEDALRGRDLIRQWRGAVVDVGSGGGSPGVPLAAVMPDRSFTLLEAERRKGDFLANVTGELENVTVVWGRAEEQPVETFGVALAKALAKPPVAVELCLPLVAEGGAVVLWVATSADLDSVSSVARQLGGELSEARDGLVVIEKVSPTPAGFPRRAGMAKKRPLV